MKKFTEWLEERDPELYVEFANTVMGGIRRIGKAAMPYVAGAAALGMGLGMGGKAHAGEPTDPSNKPAMVKSYGSGGEVDLASWNAENLRKIEAKAKIGNKLDDARRSGDDPAETARLLKIYQQMDADVQKSIDDYLAAVKAQGGGGGGGGGGVKPIQSKPMGGGEQEVPKAKPSVPMDSSGEDVFSDSYIKKIKNSKDEVDLSLISDIVYIAKYAGSQKANIPSVEAIEKFGDKAVDNYLKLTCRNPRVSIDGKEYFGTIFAKNMKNDGVDNVFNSLEILKNNPQVMQKIVSECEKSISQASKYAETKTKADVKVLQDVRNAKLKMLKELQQVLLR
jgi:hypothetical protein